MGPFVLAKLDITSKTQKIWSDSLMLAIYYSRNRQTLLQNWVCGDKPLDEILQQGSSDAAVLTLADIMGSYSLVVQINWLYQYYIDLDSKFLADKYGTVYEWYDSAEEKLLMPTVADSTTAFENPPETA